RSLSRPALRLVRMTTSRNIAGLLGPTLIAVALLRRAELSCPLGKHLSLCNLPQRYIAICCRPFNYPSSQARGEGLAGASDPHRLGCCFRWSSPDVCACGSPTGSRKRDRSMVRRVNRSIRARGLSDLQSVSTLAPDKSCQLKRS